MRVAWQKEVSQTSGEKMMRDRLRPHSVSRKDKRRASSILLLLAWAVLCLSGVLLFSNLARTSAAVTMQLVRLNVTSDAGFVRIEITADGSFDDASVEHYSRGRQSVIRIRGARSLLRQSYEINEALAREVRTVAGERNGEPYVDVLIMLGDGATIAQKKNFNRLVIGVAADFARLRRRTPSGVDVAKSRPADAVAPRAVNSITPSATASAPLGTTPIPAETLHPSSVASVPLLAASSPQAVFRGRTIWDNLPASSFQFSRLNTAGVLPMFFAQQNGAQNTTQPVFASFIRMTLEPPGARRGVWIPGTTASDRDEVGGRVMGSGFLRPSMQLGAAYGDNYFYRSTDGRNLGVFTVAPRLEYEIPGAERALRLAYEARLRRLTNGQWANAHVFDLDGRIDVTPFFRLALREHFIRSAFDTREFDPAGEVYIFGDTFNRNDAGVRAEYQLNDRSRLALDGGYNIVRWSKDRIAGAPLFIDYDELSGAISYDRDISEETTVNIGFTFGNSLSDAPFRPQFDGLSDFRRYVIEIGARTQVSETSGAAFRVGYERNDFRNAPSANDFGGLVFDLRFKQDLTESTFFELSALRKTQVSAFNLEGGNARLLSSGGAARLETATTENLKLALGLNYQRLEFPVAVVPGSTASGGVFVGQFAGEFREDHLYGFSLEAAYRVSELLKARLVYSFSRRDSTIPVFTFNRNRVSLVFDIGRRNEVTGRPF
jgi:Putative beta-barrel porin 2